METDSPIRWVRRNVFKVTQEELAEIGGVSRTRVTRYETAGDPLPFEFMQRLREEADKRGLELKADWFFAVPHIGAGNELVMAEARSQ